MEKPLERQELPCPTCGGSGKPGWMHIRFGQEEWIECITCRTKGTVKESFESAYNRVCKIARELAGMIPCPFNCNPCDYLKDPEQCILARIKAAERKVDDGKNT